MTAFLQKNCELDDENEYSLHHEFSDATTKHDEKCVSAMTSYILQKGNPFDLSGDGNLKNFVTGKLAETEHRLRLLTCVERGEEAYETFRKTRFEEKSHKLFDPIPKMHAGLKRKKSKNVTVDAQRETCDALHYIDIARDRGYSIAHLLIFELTSRPTGTSLYLTKDRFLRKSNKSELTKAIEKKLAKPALQVVTFSPTIRNRQC